MPFIFHGLIALIVLPLIVADLTEPQQQPLGAINHDGTVFDADFDRFVEEAILDWHVPGMSIAVVDNGRIESKVCLSTFLGSLTGIIGKIKTTVHHRWSMD